jgi:CDP-diacylglycerol--serine O-phosphatidyltransferase
MVKHIPNLLTLTNLFFGCVAAVSIFTQQWVLFIISISVGLVADLLDGAAARALNVHSNLGKELDSLADGLSFGFIPGLIAFQIAEKYQPGLWLNYASFIITVASVYRLAKFNLDTRQSKAFLGLPTPANAIFWVGYGYMELNTQLPGFLSSIPVLFSMVILSAWLMLSELELIKLSSIRWRTASGKLIVVLALAGIPLLIFLWLGALSVAIILYILLSLLIGTDSRTKIDTKNPS